MPFFCFATEFPDLTNEQKSASVYCQYSKYPSGFGYVDFSSEGIARLYDFDLGFAVFKDGGYVQSGVFAENVRCNTGEVFGKLGYGFQNSWAHRYSDLPDMIYGSTRLGTANFPVVKGFWEFDYVAFASGFKNNIMVLVFVGLGLWTLWLCVLLIRKVVKLYI